MTTGKHIADLCPMHRTRAGCGDWNSDWAPYSAFQAFRPPAMNRAFL